MNIQVGFVQCQSLNYESLGGGAPWLCDDTAGTVHVPFGQVCHLVAGQWIITFCSNVFQ